MCHRNVSNQPVSRALWFDCAKESTVVQTHNLEAALRSVALLRKRTPNTFYKAKEGGSSGNSASESGRCVVFTSVRDPRTWLPSLYFEKNKARLCEGDVSVDSALEGYKKWLGMGLNAAERAKSLGRLSNSFVGHSVLSFWGEENMTHALEEVTAMGGAMSFRERLSRTKMAKTAAATAAVAAAKADARLASKKAKETSGKSVASAASGEGGAGIEEGFQGCSLVFLRVEFAESSWAEAIEASVEGAKYRRTAATAKACPSAKPHYAAIKGYKVPARELDALTATRPGMRQALRYYQGED